ncbi:M1 family metallopeptidase [Archangium primigenium]|uniref:M1 family metallopeptidase n=1 Tax=[Archangium] primigenium TaxID=2792470 RepID=UPI001EF99B70|nr:M1 family metallopeptidase [Archangium primigenium]
MPMTFRRVSSVLLVLLSACGARQARPEPEASLAPVSPSLRLPTQVRPTAYTAALTLDPAQPTFQGVIDIDLEVREATSTLWLQGRALTVTEAVLTVGDQPVRVTPTKGTGDFLGFVSEQPLAPGHAHLRLIYQGQLSERETSGAFRAQDDGVWYAYTQFQPLGARRVFPCFDEPGFKVPWQLTFHVPAGSVAVTNTPLLAEEQRADGGTTFRFARTPPLPSYLLAFGVGPFDFVEARPSGQKAVRTRVLLPRGRAPEGAYAARITPEILGPLEDYFGQPYPYEKLDVLAVPNLGSAMEHPGLVTFDAAFMLARPEAYTLWRQRAVYSTQVHELAHQWFGDLVTLAWWDDLWLNEAFATWAEPRMLESAQPTWDVPLRRVLDRSSALDRDSLMTARRIRQPIQSESDIVNAFDGITYNKGAAVLSMTERWLGREVFQRGVRRYLSAHAQANATAEDFLAALSAEAGQDVSGVLGSFLDQPGAPLVTARLDCSARVPTVRLSQRRFLPLGSTGDTALSWKVPLCVRHGDGQTAGQACTVLAGTTGELPLTGAKGCPTWMLPNAEGAGYYRTAMEARALGALLTTERRHLTRPERVALLGDVQALAKAGVMPAAEALALLPGLAGETDRYVFEAATDLLSLMRPELLTEAGRAHRERFLRETYGARARALGFTPRAGEDEDTRLLRPALLRLAGREGGEPALVAEARALAERWLSDRQALVPDLVDSTLALASAHGDAALHTKLMTALRAEKERGRRQQLIWALGFFRDPNLVKKNLALLLEPDVDPRELTILLMMSGNQSRHPEVAEAFTQAHYDALAARLPEEDEARLARVASSHCDAAHRQGTAAFFTERMARAQGGARMLAQVLESIDLCIAFKAAQGASIESFLAAPPP